MPVQADLWICLSATSTPGAPGCTMQISAEQRATEITRKVKHVSDEAQDEKGKVNSSASAQQVLTALSCQAEGNLVESTRPQGAPWLPLATQASRHLTLTASVHSSDTLAYFCPRAFAPAPCSVQDTQPPGLHLAGAAMSCRSQPEMSSLHEAAKPTSSSSSVSSSSPAGTSIRP